MLPLGPPDYTDYHMVAIPDSPRSGTQLIASGDTLLVRPQTFSRSSVPTIGEMAEMENFEARMQHERTVAFEAMYDQRQGCEHAARAFEIRANQDQQRAEDRTRIRLRGEREDVLHHTRQEVEGDIRRIRGELAGAEQELMQAQPAWMGQRKHNVQLTMHAENQQQYI